MTDERAYQVEAPDLALFHKGKSHAPVEVPVPLAPLADTHGHLAHFTRGDAPDVLCRAALVGVRLLVVPIDPVSDVGPKGRFGSVPGFLQWLDQAVDEAADRISSALDAGYVPAEVGSSPFALLSHVHLVAGVHPYGAPDLDADALKRLDALLDSPRSLGVGEIGLDFGPWNELPADIQLSAFRTQLRIAHDRDLPVELHLRDGEDNHLGHELAEQLLAEVGVPKAGCDLHCFTDGPEVMAPFVEMGCHIAFGGAATFNRSEDIRAAAAVCPSHLILSETDAPYMAPVPLRGQECEPAMVAFSAARVADVRLEAGVCPRSVTYSDLWRNALSFFRLG